jgi:ATP/maltotriose-dependent transcriptional regulator MalT/DNA-binding SARP family transcriptional activator
MWWHAKILVDFPGLYTYNFSNIIRDFHTILLCWRLSMNTAKFLPPKTSFVLDRERLLNRLLSWEDKKLVVIHAQAGQGKSTLAANFIQTHSVPTVWYNLDQEDDSPGVFLNSLGRAVQATWPDRVPPPSPIPQHCYDAGATNQTIDRWVLSMFGNVPSPCLVVFDDFPGPPSSLPRLFRRLLTVTPSHVRFLVISRVRPELDIVKLRADRSVGELTGEDLRFTNAEVQDLFSLVFRMQISPTEAALVNDTAEGWPAGLVLMHEYLAALPPRARSHALIDRRASGFRTHVFDYLAQEVFVSLRPEMQQFLLRTSVSDSLSVPLMERLTGLPATSRRGPSIAGIVKELADRNLFVAARDHDEGNIRFHSLFREFLCRKLIAQTRPADVKKLYTLAAEYFRNAGDPVRSIDLLIASGQFTRAVRLIETCCEDLISHGKARTILRWVEALPLGYGDRPWFLFSRAVACRYTDPRTALAFFDSAVRRFRVDRAAYRRTHGMMLSLGGLIEASFYAGGDFRRMARAAAEAQSLLNRGGRQSGEARSRLLLALGTAYFFIGRLEQGAQALQEALDAFGKSGDPYHQIRSAMYLTPCALYQGDFHRAREAVRRGFEAHALLSDEAGGGAALFVAQALCELFEGNFDEAQKNIERSRSLADTHALEPISFLSLDIGGWLKIAQGDYPGAISFLTECKQKGEESRNAFFSASAAHLLAIAYLFQGDLDRAKKNSDLALAVQTSSESRLFHAIYLIASGAIHVKLRKFGSAEKDLTIALRMLRQAGAAQQEANAHLVLAQLYQARGKNDASARHLREGFSLGQARGFTYYALFTRHELRDLASEAAARGICTDYCESLGGLVKAPTVRICSLGGFRVFRNGKRIKDGEWKSGRAKTLLKALASEEGLTLSRDTAGELLWPGAKPEAMNQALNSMLTRIRKVLDAKEGLPGSCITLRDGVIILDKDRVWIDARRFLALVEQAERLAAQGKTAKALEEYAQALMLYQGEYLPEDLSADWSSQTRDRLRMRYHQALENMASTAETAGDHERSLSAYERLFLDDPCNEKACCWLMLRLLSDGRRSEAIRVYERCERALSRELDLEPEEETRKIYRSIIGG